MAKKKENKKLPKNEEPQSYSFKKMELFLKDWYTFKYNEVTNEIEYRDNKEDEWKNFDEMELNGLYVWYRKLNIKFPKNDLISLLYSPSTQTYNPFIDYFSELPKWDGTDRIKQMADCVKVAVDKGKEKDGEEQNRFYIQFKKMLLRTLACAIQEDFFNKQIFVLYGAKQNQYKSSFIRNLVPTALKKYYSENFNSDRDKDSAISICENFVINIDELAGLAKFELNKLKSTLSRLNEKIRLPFAKRATLIPRRASFWGTTNEETFLTDVTGNMRWICFHVLEIDGKYIDIDIDQLWAQVYALYSNKQDMAITLDELKQNEEANAKHQVMTAEMELVLKYFSQGKEDENGSAFYTSTDIVDHLSRQVTQAVRLNSVSVGRAMTYLGFHREQKKSELKKYPEKGYWIKCTCKLCEHDRANAMGLAGALN